MVNTTSSNDNPLNRSTSSQCEKPLLNMNVSSSKKTVIGEFDWSKELQGQLLSSFFFGYLFSQILGGWMAARFGGKVILGASVFISSVLTLLTPVVARTHVYLLFALRIVLGFFQGSTFPGFHTMWALWSPPMERSLLTGLNYAGCQVGNVITMPIAGFLCEHGFAGGWPSIFYTLGGVGLIWTAVWFLIVSDSPATHRRISEEERSYIQNSLGNVHLRKKAGETRAVPWRSILTSVPVLAIFVGHFAGDWGAYMMLTSLPLFMRDVLQLELTSLGIIASIPYIAYFVCINLGGYAADRLRASNTLSTLNTRRLAMLLALGSQAVFLVIAGYCGCGQETLVIVLLTLGVGLSGLQYAGFVVNYLDVAPGFAGPIVGIGNTISCVAGMVSPIIMGYFTTQGTREEWQLVFWLTGAILVVGAVVFSVFASGDVQPWAVDQKGDDSKDNDELLMNELKKGDA